MGRCTLTILVAVAWSQIAAAASLKPVEVDRFFIAPNEPTVLRWKVESGSIGEGVEYTIRDYCGAAVATGRAKVAPDDAGTLEATLKLAPGFYELEMPAGGQRFGVVAIAEYRGGADPFFSIDAAQSWLVPSDEIREALVKVLRRSGVRMARERLNWAHVNPAKDRWDWNGVLRYETLRRVHAREGVEVLEMFHNTPSWAGYVGKYPNDLLGTARAWQQIARRWRSTWGAMEIWNEPDIFFGGNLPADQYVPLVKVFAYAFAQAEIDTPLVGGVFAHNNRRYLDSAAQNGLLDSVDVASFHTYGRAPGMEALIGDYRAWLKTYGKEAMPLWITECGRPWTRGPDRPPVDQDAASALDITMKAVESRACGIARYFAFVYPFYEERDNNFGMMDRRGTPLRSMAAYARLASVLAGKAYLGDLACDDAAIQRARVFGDERETVAVLYTGRPGVDATLKPDLPGALRAEGIDGRSLEMAEDGTLPGGDGLVYVWLDRARLGDRLLSDTPAVRLWAIGRREAPSRAAPSPIVLRYRLDPAVAAATSNGYRLTGKSPEKLPLGVRVFNLSEEPHEMTLKLSCSHRAADAIGSATRSVKLPAEGFVDLAWELDLSRAFAETNHVTVTLTATGNGRLGPLVLDFDRER